MTDAPKRRWLSFSLRTMFVVVTVLCVWLGVVTNRARSRRAAIIAIDELGGTYGVYVIGPQWLRDLVKDDRFFYDASRVTLGKDSGANNSNRPFTDEDLKQMIGHLNAFGRFKNLYLSRSNITDDGLRHLKGIRRLELLDLNGTAITDKGLAHLQSIETLLQLDLVGTQVTAFGISEIHRSLPACKIIP